MRSHLWILKLKTWALHFILLNNWTVCFISEHVKTAERCCTGFYLNNCRPVNFLKYYFTCLYRCFCLVLNRWYTLRLSCKLCDICDWSFLLVFGSLFEHFCDCRLQRIFYYFFHSFFFFSFLLFKHSFGYFIFLFFLNCLRKKSKTTALQYIIFLLLVQSVVSGTIFELFFRVNYFWKHQISIVFVKIDFNLLKLFNFRLELL